MFGSFEGKIEFPGIRKMESADRYIPPSGRLEPTARGRTRARAGSQQLRRLLGEILRSKRLGLAHARLRQVDGLRSALGVTDESPFMKPIHRAKVQTLPDAPIVKFESPQEGQDGLVNLALVVF